MINNEDPLTNISYHKGIVGRGKDVSNTEDKLIIANLGTKRNVILNFNLANFL